MQTDQPTRAGNSRRLTVLSQAERAALYGLPDFDDAQRAEFFALAEAERALADRRSGPAERFHCLLQIGCFKAKQALFNVAVQEIPAEDMEFLRKHHFAGEAVALRPLRRSERYAQRAAIAGLFGYRLWSEADRPSLVETAALLARRDVTPTFLLIEVLAFLKARRIVRPGYTVPSRRPGSPRTGVVKIVASAFAMLEGRVCWAMGACGRTDGPTGEKQTNHDPADLPRLP